MTDIKIGNLLNSPVTILKEKEFPRSEGGKSFLQSLNETISNVDNLQKEADNSIKELAVGENKNIHQTMIAIEKAEISFKLMVQFRNKIIDAYQEIMRMQI